MRRLVLLAALALAACSNSNSIQRPVTPPPVSTTVVNFSTYLGNDLADAVHDIAIDSAGNTYAVGGALSVDLLPGTPTRAHAGSEDAFVAKFDPNGQVLWWTFLGGPGPDRAYAIELDSNGDIVIGGSAADQFPVTPGKALTQFQGGAGDTANPPLDGFVAKLAGVDGTLSWATYFGSGTFEADVDDNPNDAVVDFRDEADPQTSVVRDVAVDPLTNDIYLYFSVRAPTERIPPDDPNSTTDPPGTIVRNLPPVILAALQNGERAALPSLDGVVGAGSLDAILAKLSADGASLPWATYVGGTGVESSAGSVRVDPQGNPVVLLSTTSSDRAKTQDPITKVITSTESIATKDLDPMLRGSSDFFLAKHALNGPKLWSTLLGSTAEETVESANLLVLANKIVIAAQTTSSSFVPAAASGFDPSFNGGSDCGIVTLSPTGDARLASSYYGGSGGDRCTGMAVDSQDRIYVTGLTSSLDLPIRSGPLQAQIPGGRSAFLAVFSPDLAVVRHSGYFGGTGFGQGFAVQVRTDTASSARVVIGGEAGAGYPLTPSPGTPARATVTAPPEHGALSDLTAQLQ